MQFTDFKFSESILSSLQKAGYTLPTPIQLQSIPHILEGKDIAGLAQTGTGKTAAFLLPLMERILWSQKNINELSEEDKKIHQIRAFPDWKQFHYILVLVPTRELAEQVVQNVEMLGADSGLKSVSIYGGTSYEKQKDAIKRGVDFVVATPGRLIDLFKENIIDLKLVRSIVFDEADRMFDMGFKDDMKFILQRVPKDRQFLVYSATLNFDVLNTAYQFGANPVEINISRDHTKAENVKDTIMHIGEDEKPQFLLSLLKKHQPKQTIIFSNYKNNIERIVNFLNSNDIPAMGLSSLITQGQRNKVISQFKAENEHNILVATDVAARGLDIKGVDLVINFDLPSDSESYVHRIGRTGRAGAEGNAISFVSDRDVDSLMRIEDYLKHKLDSSWLEDVDILKDFKGMPSERFEHKRGHSKPFKKEFNGGKRSEKPRRHSEGQNKSNPRFNKNKEDHRKNDQQARSENFSQPNKKHHAHQQKNNFKSSRPKKPNEEKSNFQSRRPIQRDHLPVKQKSVGQKVVSFFKNLFK